MSQFNDLFSKELSDEQRTLLSRMMANLAVSDGQVDHFEASFLEPFLGQFIKGNFLKGLEATTPVTEEEIKASVGNNAEPIYAMCALMAFVDEHLDHRELELLNEYGKALGLSEQRVEELTTIARRQILNESASSIASLPGYENEKYKALQSIGERLSASPEEIENIAREHELIR